MNFTPFGIPFTGTLPVGGTAQFTTGGKFPQGLSGQVVGVLQGSEGGVHYLRPVEAPGSATTAGGQGSAGQQNVANMLPQQTLILPITLPGAKPGDPHQTVHIQVTAGNLQPKYQVTQLPIQAVQQQGGGAVLTVAYNGGQQDGVLLTDGSQGLPEGLTVVAALQPHDLQLLQTGATIQSATGQEGEDTEEKSEEEIKDHNMSQPIALVKTEQLKTEESAEHFVTGSVADYIQRMQNNSLPLSLNQFLKFNAETIKREAQIESSPLSSGGADGSAGDETNSLIVSMEPEGEELNADGTEKPKKKKKYKKKPPKPKKPKPGQVHIATALDGTTLFCCPECNMAYPDKEMLEQHLVGHKIERRFICDICGAGLKRKEHLERHKLGHNPDRPFICSVCMKGFKRKEHLNLHYVIHSGEKTEVCGECGKGFYRKDHLRKHARSHVARRLKEELQARAQQEQNGQVTATGVPTQTNVPPVQHLTIQVSNDAMDAMGISPSNVPTTQIQIPVQIHVPQHNIQVGTTSNVTNGTEGTDDSLSTEQPVSTVVLPTAAETGAMALLHTNTNGNGVQQNQSSQH